MSSGRGKLFVLSGASGGGKTTIIKQIIRLRSNFVFSISFTTREPRKEEIDGVDYYFVSHKEFHRKIKAGDFLEWAEVHGEFYGTDREKTIELLDDGKNIILDVDVHGGESLHKTYPEAVMIFIYPPSVEELRRRLIARGTNTMEQIEKRISRYPYEKKQGEKYDYRVLNEDLDATVKAVLEIIDDHLV